jgi:hypothetical protein
LASSCALPLRDFLLGSGFFNPRARSASSSNLEVLGIPPTRFSQARSPVGPLSRERGETQSSSAESFFLPLFFFFPTILTLYSHAQRVPVLWPACFDITLATPKYPQRRCSVSPISVRTMMRIFCSSGWAFQHRNTSNRWPGLIPLILPANATVRD